jgi:hypothetical protein
MSDPHSVTTQMAALISLVEESRESKQREILMAAQGEAAEIIINSYGEARLRLKEQVAKERRQMAQAQKSAQAQRETEQRRHRLKSYDALLIKARLLLKTALENRWNEPSSRKDWLDFVANQAIRFLPRGEWQVLCGRGIGEEDRQRLKERIEKECPSTLLFQVDEESNVGLKIGCKGAWVDGTLDGLLADSRSIDGQLLGLMALIGKQS